MITLIARQDAGSVRLSLAEGVEEVPGLAAGGAPEVILLGVPAIWRDTVRLSAAASLLSGVKHMPLRESILVLDHGTRERLAFVEKL
jgi:hypothetical protein